ncbi:MAG TPA: SdpI family protein [Fimbriimonas sp.]
MTLRRAVLWQLGAFGASVAASAVYGAFLPDRVPTHWGLSGQPDAWGSKWINLLMMPGMLLAFIVLTLVLPAISPKGYRIESFSGTYGYVMALVSGLFLTLHVIILQASLAPSLDMGRFIIAAIFGFFALIGNVLGRVKRNFWVGIRTPWTLASEQVWKETHRSAARLWLIGGIVGVLASLVGVNPPLLFAYLMVLAFVPVFQSFLISRRLG